MEPQPETRAAGPEGVDGQVLRRAVAIYLEHAYAGSEPPPAVGRRLQWVDAPGPVPIAGPPFEPSEPTGAERSVVYSLRLGNARYPHMKLQVQPWPSPTGFLLSVNTHDQVTPPDPGSPEAEAFRALQAANQQYKQAIEAAWDEAGLPTFLRYLRDYIEAGRPRDPEPG